MTLKLSKSAIDWLRRRHALLTSSDAPAAIGVDPWRSSFALGVEKAQPFVEPDGNVAEYLEWGSRLEHCVRQAVRDRFGQSVHYRSWDLRRSERHPTLGSTLDGWFESAEIPIVELFINHGIETGNFSGPGLLEIKTVGPYAQKKWRDGIPIHYQVQTQAALLVTGWQWGVLAALFGGQEMRCYPFQRHPETTEKLAEYLPRFLDRVKLGILPDPVGSESCLRALGELHPDDNGLSVELPAEIDQFDSEIAAIEESLESLKARRSELRAQIQAAIGDATYGILPSGVTYSWKTQERKAHSVSASKFRVLRRRSSDGQKTTQTANGSRAAGKDF